MEEKNKKMQHESNYDKYFDLDKIVSSTECTGLMPTPALSAEEAESYTDIYNIPQPKDNKVDSKHNGIQHKSK